MSDVLLVTVDSLRADHVHHLGYERETTPNIDKVAAGGHTFTNAFAHACSTRPSFPSILSSSHALKHGGFETMTSGRTMLAEVFDGRDYRTAAFHSNLYLGADFGYDRGFDTFYDSRSDPPLTARARQFVRDSLDEDGFVYRFLASAFDSAERRAGINIGSAYDSAEEITDRALRWVRNVATDGPRFLWVHYMDVHHPYVPPDDHQRAFRDEPIGESSAIKLRRKMIQEPEAVTDGEFQDIIDLYDAEIRFTDAEIHRLVDGVREAWDEDPVVAITADHGEEFREHGQFSHHATFYDEVLHVPLVLDGVPGSGRHRELVGLLDLPTTLVDYAGLTVPPEFEGYSLRSILEGNDWPREYVIGDWGNREDERRFAYRDEDWKLIRRGDGEELYHLPEDSREQVDVRDENSDVAEEFGTVLDEHQRQIAESGDELVEVQMDEDVKARLRDLGYKE